MARRRIHESIAALGADLVAAKILVWVASAGRDVELTPEAHLYFFDRYARLARYYRTRGNESKAHRLEWKAREHYRLGAGGDGPPYAAAMGMPRPARWVTTHAAGRELRGPDDAA